MLRFEVSLFGGEMKTGTKRMMFSHQDNSGQDTNRHISSHNAQFIHGVFRICFKADHWMIHDRHLAKLCSKDPET